MDRPIRSLGGESTYHRFPWDNMEIGDTFQLPWGYPTPHGLVDRTNNSSRRKANGKMFEVRRAEIIGPHFPRGSKRRCFRYRYIVQRVS